MAKKNQKKPISTAFHTTIASSKSPPGSFSSWLNEAFISPGSNEGKISAFGYGMTLVLFLLLIAYFVEGYSVRPRILDRDFVPRLLNPPSDISGEMYRIGPDDSGIKAQSEEGEQGILFKVGPDTISGLIISTNLLHLPDDARNFGLSIYSAYQGIPSLNYGFINQLPDENQIDALRKCITVSTEMPPSQDQMRYFISMAGSFYTPNHFSVPWPEARYFYFFFSSPVSTQIFLNNIFFIEKR